MRSHGAGGAREPRGRRLEELGKERLFGLFRLLLGGGGGGGGGGDCVSRSARAIESEHDGVVDAELGLALEYGADGLVGGATAVDRVDLDEQVVGSQAGAPQLGARVAVERGADVRRAVAVDEERPRRRCR